ncbi:glycosyltransferase [Rhodopirellula europaea]|uniref:glycosyltransferase n=1 Tax=Rhodopirellula europaea TaxID=1263866 RepID=UPI003D2AB1FB
MNNAAATPVRISVAMATYNGERFLTEQLNSLALQKHLPHELVACDDGSTDDTVSILQEFSRRAPFPVHIHQNKVNLGYSDNFLKAARACDGEWVAFCDQDDVWLENKLQMAAQATQKHTNLNLILQNALITDSRLNSRGRLFPNKLRRGIYQANRQYGFWVWPGFLKTMRADNFSLFQSTDRPRSYFPGDSVQTHDKWTCMVANAVGGIAVQDQPVALYRRHDEALTGSYSIQSPRARLEKAKLVGSSHYAFLSSVALEYSCLLEGYRFTAKDRYQESTISQSALGFQKIAKIQDSRSRLYRESSYLKRLRYFGEIARHGGYIGKAFHSMGLKSMAKDLAWIACGSRCLSR